MNFGFFMEMFVLKYFLMQEVFGFVMLFFMWGERLFGEFKEWLCRRLQEVNFKGVYIMKVFMERCVIVYYLDMIVQILFICLGLLNVRENVN